MSAPTTLVPDTDPGMATERLTAREVREAAYRALRAAGASAGEASAAAATVVEAEIQGWDGLGAVLREIETLSADGPGPECSSHDGVCLVDDPACRGPLLLGRPVFDCAVAQAARAIPIRTFVRGLGYHRVLLGFALGLAGRAQGRTTVLAEVASSGATTSAVACTSDGRILAPADPAEADQHIPKPPRSVLSDLCGGVAVTDDRYAATTTEQWHVLSTSAERMDHQADALRNGLNVRPGTWAAVQRAAQRFLVAERCDTPTQQG